MLTTIVTLRDAVHTEGGALVRPDELACGGKGTRSTVQCVTCKHGRLGDNAIGRSAAYGVLNGRLVCAKTYPVSGRFVAGRQVL